jgi:hypothetical protein
MAEIVTVIGTLPQELPWLRMLVALLRHPDPNVAELTRQALLYLTRSAARKTGDAQALGPAG